MSEEISQSIAEETLNPSIHEEEFEAFKEEDKPDGDPLCIANFDTLIGALNSNEDKLKLALQFMRNSLDQNGSPYFKGFWHARQLATALFKESINAAQRSELWKNYRDLCSEFRKLKEVLDENAAFAAEQIEIAIKAATTELENFDEQIKKQTDIEFPLESQVISKNFKFYNQLQKELNLLNAYALRINALRKELIKTEMRIRVKNKFFKDLSLLGDKVFPKRKELIKHLSNHFVDDVNSFIERNFKGNEVNGAFFFLREEIKALQSIAKILTLNTHAFTATRTKLSQCWDLVKAADKDKKKEIAEKRGIFKQNEEVVKEQIILFQQEMSTSELTEKDFESKVSHIFSYMKTLELGKEEKHALRELLNEVQKPFLDKIKEQEEERIRHSEKLAKERQEKVESFKDSLQNLLHEAKALTVESVEQKKDDLLKLFHEIQCSRTEKLSLEKIFKNIKDLIIEKRQHALLNLSEDDQSHLAQLKEALKDREESRKEVKDLLDQLKKQKNSSSVSFEKALQFNESIEEEKERLSKIESSIEDIQSKIKKLSQKATT